MLPVRVLGATLVLATAVRFTAVLASARKIDEAPALIEVAPLSFTAGVDGLVEVASLVEFLSKSAVGTITV